MSFKDIKGQDNAVLFLKGVLSADRISQAYIFLGPRGVGKRLAAINFAKAMNCLAAASEKPCDECASCRKADSSNHPDISVLKPEKEGASVKIDEIRALVKDVALKPYEGRRKVYILDNASYMTQEASNALLKTLEEPVSESVIILIVEEMTDILKTISSRSQVVRFYPLKIEEIKEILVTKYKVDEVRAHILAHLASGRLGEAIHYTNEEFFEKRARVIDNITKGTFFDSDLDDIPKEDLNIYLDIMLAWYRDIMVAKVSGTESGDCLTLVNIDRRSEIMDEAKRSDLGRVGEIINQIVSTSSFLDQNANPKLVMSVLGLQQIK